MKDITVALELTIIEGHSDEDIQQTVQQVVKAGLKALGKEVEWIDDVLCDVKAITDGVFVDFTEPEWRVLEYAS